MADLTNVLGGPWQPSESQPGTPEDQMKQAMLNAGLTPPDYIEMDGNIHRFRSDEKNDKAGWYVLYGDGVPSGQFGCFRTGVEVKFKANVGRKYTVAEEMAITRRMQEAKRQRDEQIAKQRQTAASTVESIWAGCSMASSDHPYLKRKGIQAHGTRVTGDGRLICPLYSPDGELASLQYIDSDGGKLYHPGGQTGGCFYVLGNIYDQGAVYVAEGFATAATIAERTGRPCLVSYSASNLVPVVAWLRETLGESGKISIMADNDKSGVGLRYAEQASAKYGARVIMPPIEGMDANDYVQAGHDLEALVLQNTGHGLIDKLKVIFGSELGEEYQAPDELVEGLITQGSAVVVYGDSNSGKTFWALSVAAAVSNGWECYGKKTEKGLVVYLASEAPGSIKSRMQAIKKFYKCDLENLAMVPVPVNFYEGDQDSNDVINMIHAIEEIKGEKVRLVIADTLARISAGANENSGEDMGPVMARFDQIATATGAAMMIIHHNGKDAARGARGWSGIRAHIDTEIEVVENSGVRCATVTKQRELPSKGDSIYFKLEVIEMGQTKFGAMATTCVAVEDADAEQTQPDKKPSKHVENIRLFERAWWASGTETRDGLPYVSRSALRELLIKDGMSERTAKNKTEASRSDGVISMLLNAGFIDTTEHGWKVIEAGQSSAMLMSKNAPKRP